MCVEYSWKSHLAISSSLASLALGTPLRTVVLYRMEVQLSSGHRAAPLESEEWGTHERVWKGYTHGLLRLSPGRWLFPTDFKKFADALYNFEFKTRDVVVMTWPKCGTTWTQEILWTMRNNPDLTSPDADKPINTRVPFIDMDMFLGSHTMSELGPTSSSAEEPKMMCPDKGLANGLYLQLAEALPEPRTFKTHLPFSLLTPSLLDNAKVVYVARKPHDVLVSYYHHSRLFKVMSYEGTLEQFLKFFLNDDLVYGPYWLHLKEAWEKRDHPNMHFVFYEDLKADIMGELGRFNDFLGTNLTREQLENVQMYTRFEEMKARDNVFKDTGDVELYLNDAVVQKDGGFFRKGQAGGWRDQLTEEQTHQLDLWVDEHITSFGMTFPGADHQQ